MEPRALQARAPRSVGPWTGDQLLSVLVANGIGLALAVVGIWVATGRDAPQEQLPGVNLTVLGLIIAGSANALWLARARRVVKLARRATFSSLASRTGGQLQSDRPTVSVGLVAVPGTARYHRASCLLVGGKDVESGTRAEHTQASRGACEVCRP